MATHFANIARPYAQAAFQYAKEQSDFSAWRVFLETAALVIEDTTLYPLIASYALNKEELNTLFFGVLNTSINEARGNFLRLILQNQRFIILPDIAAEFERLFAAFMKKANVRVITAIQASDAFKASLTKQLSLTLKQEIELHCEKDPTILGGAVIYVNNKVIDGSLRGKLNRLLEFTLR